jgi:hypothetical protein
MNSEIPNQQILEGAKYYNQAHGMLDESGSDWVLLPAIHCAAIAMELYLKSLCGQNNRTPSPFAQDVEVVTATSPHGHCLPSLYDKAPPPAFRKDDTPLNRKPGGLMEQSNASLQRGDQG